MLRESHVRRVKPGCCGLAALGASMAFQSESGCGCHPIELSDYLWADFWIVHYRAVVISWGLTSEVLIAQQRQPSLYRFSFESLATCFATLGAARTTGPAVEVGAESHLASFG